MRGPPEDETVEQGAVGIIPAYAGTTYLETYRFDLQ